MVNTVLLRGGQLIGLLGTVLMLVSVAARFAGNFTLGEYQTGTLLLAGIGAVVVACFMLLWLIAERGQR
jgi:hypothetical protein